MMKTGHFDGADGQSNFRVFAPERRSVRVLLPDLDLAIDLQPEGLGYWSGSRSRLADGSRYWIEVDGERWPDVASRLQPDGVHGASAVARPRRAVSANWRGVRLEDAVIYELHLGTFTAQGTLIAAMAELQHLATLGITVIELLPIAAFPGKWNWGYDGTYPYALHAGYGSYEELAAFIDAAHASGMAVLLDVVHNHFGPEGNYAANFAPYTKSAETPWGAAINFSREFNHGVREYFLGNVRYWLEEVGFDGLRMDAVSMIYDDMPRHILRQMTDLAREIGLAQQREILMVAEHLRNNRHVTADPGYAFDTQWNDDLTHAVFAHLTGERRGHYENFGSFDDIVTVFERAYVLDGTRFDHYYRCLTGTDGSATRATEHVVYIQNHDQIGNRPYGDRMITTYGKDRALLALTAALASPYVPMFYMGDEYGETAPFMFFEDFSDPAVIEGVRAGRRKEYDFGQSVPPDPHAQSSFEGSKLQWRLRDGKEGAAILAYFRAIVALKRSGALGPRDRAAVAVQSDRAQQVLQLRTPQTLTLLNFSAEDRQVEVDPGWALYLASVPMAHPDRLPAYGAVVYRRDAGDAALQDSSP